MKVKFVHLIKPIKTSNTNIPLFYKTLFDGTITDILNNKSDGIEYVRLQHLIWSGSTIEDMDKCSRTQFKPQLLDTINYSYHLPYMFNYLSDTNFNLIKDYLIKLTFLIRNQRLFNMKLCCHLPNNPDLAIRLWSELFDVCREQYYFNIDRYLYFENCDKNLDLANTLKVANEFNIPIVFDNLHDDLNPSESLILDDIIKELCHQWYLRNSPPYIHYSSYKDSKGRHGDYINIEEFNNLILKFKPYTDVLIVVPELENYKQALINFKTDTINKYKWINQYTFEVN